MRLERNQVFKNSIHQFFSSSSIEIYQSFVCSLVAPFVHYLLSVHSLVLCVTDRALLLLSCTLGFVFDHSPLSRFYICRDPCPSVWFILNRSDAGFWRQQVQFVQFQWIWSAKLLAYWQFPDMGSTGPMGWILPENLFSAWSHLFIYFWFFCFLFFSHLISFLLDLNAVTNSIARSPGPTKWSTYS